jgi:hypothetical protein
VHVPGAQVVADDRHAVGGGGAVADALGPEVMGERDASHRRRAGEDRHQEEP